MHDSNAAYKNGIFQNFLKKVKTQYTIKYMKNIS